MSHVKNRDPNFTYNLKMIKKFAARELATSCEAIAWYKLYFDCKTYQIGDPFDMIDKKEKDQFQTIGVDKIDRLLFGSIEDAPRRLRFVIKISDLTDEERKDLFNTIQTACDAVSL